MLVMKIRIMFSQLKKVVSLFICRILFFLCSHFASTTRGRPPLLTRSLNIYNFSAPILGLHNVDLRRTRPLSSGQVEQNQGKHTLWKLKEIQTPMAWPLCSPCWGRRRRRKSPRRRRNTSLAQEDFLTLISSCLNNSLPFSGTWWKISQQSFAQNQIKDAAKILRTLFARMQSSCSQKLILIFII